MTEWQDEDEVITNFKTLKQAQAEEYTRGWSEAIEYVIEVANLMLTRPDQDGQYDKYTIEELKQRIV
jgi:hypothetical protein